MESIWLLTTGRHGVDGDEWNLESIHSTKQKAEIAKHTYGIPKFRSDGSKYNYKADIEEWDIDP